MDAVKVTAAAVVLPTLDGREVYHYRGAVLPVDGFTEAGLEHALDVGLIEEVDIEEIEEDETPVSFSQTDVDAAVKAAEDAKVAEFKSERDAIEKAKADLAAARAEFDKRTAPTPKGPAAK